ncbi:MAG TPA: sodium:solute symporter family protein [Methanosarcinales archaeon]|nr:sodium:solute symporter family protein [Methanosarcinales archaeon]
MYTFLILLILYIVSLIAIGWHFAKRQRTMTDFWIAGREIGTVNIGMSAAASWLTAGALFGVTGMFLSIGLGSVWIFVAPNIIALALIAVLVPRIKRLPSLTQPELIEIRYGPVLRAPIAIAITIVMILFAVTDFKGFGYVLEVFYGIPPIYSVAIMVIAISLYVTLGGLRAVIWTDTIQFIFLAALAILIGAIALFTPAHGPDVSVSDLFDGMEPGFWNLFALGGIIGVFIMQIAMLPGWVTEQDPWQRVWAARDVKSARSGMLIGSALIAVVFGACFLAAIGIHSLYDVPPDLHAAEQLYLTFIQDTFAYSPVILAFIAIGFAAASMSCADTFATSGASCISRDIYQRFIKPDVTMGEMRTINRILIVAMVIISATISMHVDTVLDAVIMATVIGTASYFLPIMGALFWRRATAQGALAGLVIGGGTQITLIIAEVTYFGKLDAISPLLIEHGVLIGVLLSAVTFVGVSLATPQSDDRRLAPFFADVAERFLKRASVDTGDPAYTMFKSGIKEYVSGERIHLSAVVKTESRFDWGKLVLKLAGTGAWIAPSGVEVAYRLSSTDMLACPRIVHGGEDQVWIFAEPGADQVDDIRAEMFAAYREILDAAAATV